MLTARAPAARWVRRCSRPTHRRRARSKRRLSKTNQEATLALPHPNKTKKEVERAQGSRSRGIAMHVRTRAPHPPVVAASFRSLRPSSGRQMQCRLETKTNQRNGWLFLSTHRRDTPVAFLFRPTRLHAQATPRPFTLPVNVCTPSRTESCVGSCEALLTCGRWERGVPTPRTWDWRHGSCSAHVRVFFCVLFP